MPQTCRYILWRGCPFAETFENSLTLLAGIANMYIVAVVSILNRQRQTVLTSTFVHAQGIGYATERQIWELGAVTWSRFLEIHPEIRLSERKKALLLPCIEESILRLAQRDYRFFSRRLRKSDHWRAVSEFGNRLAYLDIETTGCGWDDQITVIGVYDGEEMHTFVWGQNLLSFPEFISQFEVLVTFAGSTFDLPFIKKHFPGLELDQLHVDLMYMLRGLELRGGLKNIERQLGICRRPEVEGMTGFDAVRLWQEYRRGSTEALELLLTYNKEDVMNMSYLLEYGCKLMRDGLGLPAADENQS